MLHSKNDFCKFQIFVKKKSIENLFYSKIYKNSQKQKVYFSENVLINIYLNNITGEVLL